MRRLSPVVLLLSVVSILLVFLSSSSSNTGVVDAAVLSLGQMWREATHVWTGVITEVDEKIHDQEGFIDWRNNHYRLTVNVTAVGKSRGLLEKQAHHHKHAQTEAKLRHNAEGLPPHEGEGAVEHPDHVDDDLHDDETINVGDLIHVHFWKAVSRPPGYKLPDSPGIRGMSTDVDLAVGKEFAYFGEYLQRDQVRRYMYHHTHPGKIRRRKHTSSSASKSKSQSQVEGGADQQQQQNTNEPEEGEFTYIKSYIAFVPDGITPDLEGALAAKDADVDSEQQSESQSKKVDL